MQIPDTIHWQNKQKTQQSREYTFTSQRTRQRNITTPVGMQGTPWSQDTTRSAAGSAWTGSSTSSAARHAHQRPAATARAAPAPGSPSARAPAPCQRPLCTTTAASALRPPAALHLRRPTSSTLLATTPRHGLASPPPLVDLIAF